MISKLQALSALTLLGIGTSCVAQQAPLVAAPAPAAPPAPVSLRVDAGAATHAISPLIYGTAQMESQSQSDVAGILRTLNLPLNRWGGNFTSRYNWQENVTNRARD